MEAQSVSMHCYEIKTELHNSKHKLIQGLYAQLKRRARCHGAVLLYEQNW